MAVAESNGIVLDSKRYKEHDCLVKIFTERFGKKTFLIRRGAKSNYPYYRNIQPLAKACYIGKYQEHGLSYLTTVKDEVFYSKVNYNIELKAYAIYLLQLADAALEDSVPDPMLYGYLIKMLNLMNDGIDAAVLTNIYEVQMLRRFGVYPHLEKCQICGEKRLDVPFDYSPEYGGVICYHHFEDSVQRYHAHPRAVYFLRQFQSIDVENLKTINVSEETKCLLRHLIDQLYEDYVGIRLKSKRFIDQMYLHPSLFDKKTEEH